MNQDDLLPAATVLGSIGDLVEVRAGDPAPNSPYKQLDCSELAEQGPSVADGHTLQAKSMHCTLPLVPIELLRIRHVPPRGDWRGA